MFQVNGNWTTSTSRSSVFFVVSDSTPYAGSFTANFEHVIAGLVCMVWETENLMTSQYTVYSEIPFNRNLYI